VVNQLALDPGVGDCNICHQTADRRFRGLIQKSTALVLVLFSDPNLALRTKYCAAIAVSGDPGRAGRSQPEAGDMDLGHTPALHRI